MSASTTSQNTMGASSSTSISDSSPSDLDTSNQVLTKLYEEFHSVKCRSPSCDVTLFLGDIEQHIDAWLSRSQSIPPASQISQIACSGCKTITCIGCGGEPVFAKHHEFTPLGVVNNCCIRGRLFGIWLLLSRFDEEELKRNRAPRKSPAKRKTSLPKGSGVGYAGAGHGDWDEWDEPFIPDSVWPGEMPSRTCYTKIVDDEEISPDISMTSTLQLLVALLPVPTSAPTSGSPTQPLEELFLFRLSFLLDRVADLMRNGSISDMTERYCLYSAAFAFVEVIAKHPGLSQLLYEKRPEKGDSQGLCISSKDARVSSKVPKEFAASLFAGMVESHKEAKAFLKLTETSSHKTERKSYLGQNKDPVRICKTFIELHDALAKTAPALGGSVETSLKDPWTQYAEDHRVTFTDAVLKGHAFDSLFSTVNTSPPGRLSTIGKEIANMTTNLPTGIFLKVAESRSDVMKVMIVGPDGSPYTGGLFIFDMFLDTNYPASPPKVKFVLEDDLSGGFSFNPNLHPGGTVCLSLINTWSGNPQEMWQPNKSTTLSVLVSIQAMILGAPLPWVNEPGYNGQGETPQPHEHKLLCQCKTVRYAMIGWLPTKSKAKESLWSEISEEFWKHHALENLERVREWSKTNEMMRKYDFKAYPHHSTYPASRHSKPKVVEENLLEKLEQIIIDKYGLGGGPASNPNHPIVIDDATTPTTEKGKGKKKAPTVKATPKAKGKKVAGYLPSTASSSKSKAKGKGSVKEETPTQEAEANIVEPSTSKSKKAATSTSKSKGKKTGTKRQRSEEEEDSDEDDMSAPPAKRRRSTRNAKAASKDDDVVDVKKTGSSFSADSALQQQEDKQQQLSNNKQSQPQQQQQQSSQQQSKQQRWVYTGDKTQKEVRGVCKEFGISYASTIKESVEKLERYVNEKGKVGGELVERWGEMRMV